MPHGSSVTHAMLMAAGLGTRLRPFTDRVPKAFVPVLGVPIAQFAIDALARAGAQKIVMNIHHLADSARASAARLDWGGVAWKLSDESGELLGSGGGIRRASPDLGTGPFFLVNADVLTDIDLSALALAHARHRRNFGALLTLALLPAGARGGRYREIQFDGVSGKVTGLGELAEGRTFFAGASVLEPDALRWLPACGPAEFVPTILEPALRAGLVGAYCAPARWEDVGSPELWLQAHLGMIAQLETGRLSPTIRRRIEGVSRRVSAGIWVDRRAPRDLRTFDWGAPAYWSPGSDASARPPRELGPRAVLYGNAPARPLRDAIWLADEMRREA